MTVNAVVKRPVVIRVFMKMKATRNIGKSIWRRAINEEVKRKHKIKQSRQNRYLQVQFPIAIFILKSKIASLFALIKISFKVILSITQILFKNFLCFKALLSKPFKPLLVFCFEAYESFLFWGIWIIWINLCRLYQQFLALYKVVPDLFFKSRF